MRPYQSAGLTLDANSGGPRNLVLALQEDLRTLGYIDGGLDGSFGPGTARGLAALSYDLLHNGGASTGRDGRAPVSIASFNKGRIRGVQGTLDQPLADCMAELIADAGVPKLPRALDPKAQNASALAATGAILNATSPVPFLLAMFVQESDSRHYKVPTSTDADDFISVGLDRNDEGAPDRITSRGYGLGQATLYHHPPSFGEIAALMVDPAANARAAISELRSKFDQWVVGPADRASDRDAEHPGLKLRLCRYAQSDARYLRDCRSCARSARTIVISRGTPLYSGASQSYQPDQYYPSADYGSVPDRADFLCDWPYAARRYNGSGLNSFHYQTRILLNLTRLSPGAVEVDS